MQQKPRIAAAVAASEEETKKIDYKTLDRLIDSITQDFSRKGISSRLKALARKSVNTATICDHIVAEQIEHHIKASTAESKVKALLWLSKYLDDDKLGHRRRLQYYRIGTTRTCRNHGRNGSV
jgi:hypothetical protein